MQEKIKTNKRVLIVIIFLLLFAIYNVVVARSEYLQIVEIGENYASVFSTNIFYKYVIMGINFITLFILIYITNLFIKKGIKAFFIEEKKEMPKLPNKSIALIISAIVSILSSDLIKEKAILFFNSTWFEKTDQIFGNDIGYYMFQKPFIEFILVYIMAVFVLLAVYTIIYYIISFNVYFDGIELKLLKKSTFFKQLMAFVVLISFALSLLTLVQTQNILFEEFIQLEDADKTSLLGAGFTDVTIKLWGYRIFAVIIFACANLGVYFFRKENYKKTIISLISIPCYLIGLFIVMTGFQWVFVDGSKLDKEKMYIGYHIENTQNAYNINIDEIQLENGGTINNIYAEEYKNVIENIPIVSEEITLSTLNEYQDSVGFYSYENTKLQNYRIQGKDSLVYVSPREIVIDGVSRSYDNKTYDYTHGYGSIVTYGCKTDEVGNVEYLQSSFVGNDQVIKINEPRIYFGLHTNSSIVVGSETRKEFDYPTTSSTNEVNNYTGLAGLKLNLFDKFVLGVTTNNFNLTFSGEGKIILNRNIIDRAKKLMPYLIYDENPYLVIDDSGNQIWVLDAYSVSDNYPYAQKTYIEMEDSRTRINYIRNSVKVLVDSYNGTVKFYITDRTDPVVMAYYKLYPELFQNIEETIPEDVAKHIVYPELMYNVQAQMYKKYHKIQEEVLYRSDDVWDIARFNANSSSINSGTKFSPYYTMLKTINSDVSFGLVIPYTNYGKQNIVSYLVGTYNIETGNRLTLYKFDTSSNILGPAQLNQQIDLDETISNEIEALNKTGTKLIKNMLIVPIEDTLLYVEPIYQVRVNEPGSLPTLVKIVVASGNKLAIGNTLEEALENLLSKEAVNIEIEETDTEEDLINAIIKANQNLEESSNNIDWEMMGKEIKKLQELILKLEELKKSENNIVNTIDENTINIVQNEIINSTNQF